MQRGRQLEPCGCQHTLAACGLTQEEKQYKTECSDAGRGNNDQEARYKKKKTVAVSGEINGISLSAFYGFQTFQVWFSSNKDPETGWCTLLCEASLHADPSFPWTEWNSRS